MEKSLKVSLRIILLFSVAIFLSFIPQLLHTFFGDWHCNGSGVARLIPETKRMYEHYEYSGCKYDTMVHEPTWHWGYRHWLWLCMDISLAIVQIVDIIKIIDKD